MANSFAFSFPKLELLYSNNSLIKFITVININDKRSKSSCYIE